MKLGLPVKIKSVHLHIVADMPGKEDAHLDLLANDPDGDGDPNLKAKWDLPGTMFDSGPEGVKVEVPMMSFVKPIVNGAIGLVSMVAPPGIKQVLQALELD